MKGKPESLNCLSAYSKQTHGCMKTLKGKKPKEYKTCLLDASHDLEACSLEELIVDQDNLHNYDVDHTAYLPAKTIAHAVKEIDAMLKAIAYNLKNQKTKEKKQVWGKYKVQFEKEFKSLKLEYKIASKQVQVIMEQEHKVNMKECIAREQPQYLRSKKDFEAFQELLRKAGINIPKAIEMIKRLKPDVDKALIDFDKIKDEVRELLQVGSTVENEREGLLGEIKEFETRLGKLIEARERQPKPRMGLKKGVRISTWNQQIFDSPDPAKGNKMPRWINNKKYKTLRPDKQYDSDLSVAKGKLRLGEHELKMLNGHRHDHFSFKFQGAIKAPMDGMYTAYINSDDGGILFFSEDADGIDKVFIQNAAPHTHHPHNGKWIVQKKFHMKKGDFQPWCFTMFEGGGYSYAEVKFLDPKGKELPMTQIEWDHSASEVPDYLPPKLVPGVRVKAWWYNSRQNVYTRFADNFGIWRKQNAKVPHVAVGWATQNNFNNIKPEYDWTTTQFKSGHCRLDHNGINRFFRTQNKHYNNHNLAMMFQGAFKAPATGAYTVLIDSDDGALFYLNDKPTQESAFLNNAYPAWGHGFGGQWRKTRKFNLKAGDVQNWSLTWYQGNGGQFLEFWIKGPDGKLIPMTREK